MKKRICIGFLVLVFFSMLTVKAETAFSPQFNVTVSVVGLPSLVVESPRNETYFSNESLKLRVLSNGDLIWHNLDNGFNFTYNGEIDLAATEGGHVLHVFANNSYGTSKKNVSFNVNLSLFRIIYGEYNGSFKGNSTDFNGFSFNQIQNLGGIILENTNYGKITFLENVNLTADANESDKTLNLDAYSELSFNKIELDTQNLPNFNKGATLIFYNLPFTNPRILLNGAECPLTVCTLLSYSGGTLVFNANSLGSFSIEEVVAPIDNSGTGTSGGGGSSGGSFGSVLVRNEFSIDKENIALSLKKSTARREQFIIENTANKDLNIKITHNLGDFLRLNEKEFILKKGEKKIILADFLVLEDKKEDIYLGKIIVSSQSTTKEVLVAIEVESRNPLFDIKVSIPEDYLKIKPGGELVAEVSLLNIERVGIVDTEINYIIKDSEDNIVLNEHETVAVETQSSFVKKFRLAGTLKEGEYVLYANVAYSGQVGSSSAFFMIDKGKEISPRLAYILILLIVLLTLILFIIKRRKKDDQNPPNKKQGRRRKFYSSTLNKD